MSILLADIDATCSSLGRHKENQYNIAENAVQSLKVKYYFLLFFSSSDDVIYFSI